MSVDTQAATDRLMRFLAVEGVTGKEAAIGRELGFNETICTEVRWDGDHLDGTLTTPNRNSASVITEIPTSAMGVLISLSRT